MLEIPRHQVRLQRLTEERIRRDVEAETPQPRAIRSAPRRRPQRKAEPPPNTPTSEGQNK